MTIITIVISLGAIAFGIKIVINGIMTIVDAIKN